MRITTGVVLQLLGEIGAILTKNGVLNAAGDFTTPLHAPAIAKAAAEIETVLVAHGVTVQGNIEQAIQALPFLLPLLGLR